MQSHIGDSSRLGEERELTSARPNAGAIGKGEKMDTKNLKRKHRDLRNRIDELKVVHGELKVAIDEENLEMAKEVAVELKDDFNSTMKEYLLPLVQKIDSSGG